MIVISIGYIWLTITRWWKSDSVPQFVAAQMPCRCVWLLQPIQQILSAFDISQRDYRYGRYESTKKWQQNVKMLQEISQIQINSLYNTISMAIFQFANCWHNQRVKRKRRKLPATFVGGLSSLGGEKHSPNFPISSISWNISCCRMVPPNVMWTKVGL